MLKTQYGIWLLFTMVLSAYNINAQNNTNSITGSILDNSSNLPVFYVNVALLNEVDSTIVDVTFSDKEGAFSFSNLKVGDYIIKTSYIGYDTYQEPVSVTGDKKVIKLETFLLKPIATELQGITISATKPIYMNTGEKILYNVTEDPSVQTGTVANKPFGIYCDTINRSKQLSTIAKFRNKYFEDNFSTTMEYKN